MRHMFKSILAFSIAGILLSCNNETSKTTEDVSTTMSDSAATAMSTTADRPAVPFDIVSTYHTVKDYNAWRTAFDANPALRAENGLTTIAVERNADKPNDVKLIFRVDDLAKAKAFIADPKLKDAMDKAGVMSKPDMQFWTIVRMNSENIVPGATRMQVVHKVKDFDEWIKVYDAEGPATRAEHGLADIAVARNMEDPNLVHIAFNVTDMAKAKARLTDPALKKLMTDAGVTGTPEIIFYNDATK